MLKKNLENRIENLKLRTQSMEGRMLKIQDDHPELAAGLSRGIERIDETISEAQLILDDLEQLEEQK